MKKIITVLSAALLLASASVQAQSKKVEGNGNITKQSRTAESFTGVTVAGSMVVKVKSGAQSVQVEADDNLQEYITTEVKNGNLRIGTKNGYNIKTKQTITVYVSLETISSATVAGSGTIKGEGALKAADKFEVTIAGSGNCQLDVTAAKTGATISGSGSISLAGSTDKLDVNIAGSGNYKGFDMKSAQTDVAISGSGNVETTTSGKLDAHIAGSGSVLYKGTNDVSIKTVGSGSLRKVD